MLVPVSAFLSMFELKRMNEEGYVWRGDLEGYLSEVDENLFLVFCRTSW